MVLLLSAVVPVVVLIAVAWQLRGIERVHTWAQAGELALVVATVVLAWGVVQVAFALHYAHDFYLAAHHGGQSGGLDFPRTGAAPHDDFRPTYLDFLYVACVIGTSGQTADVTFTSPAMRRLGLLHCVLAFFFNTTVLALAVNVGASKL